MEPNTTRAFTRTPPEVYEAPKALVIGVALTTLGDRPITEPLTDEEHAIIDEKAGYLVDVTQSDDFVYDDVDLRWSGPATRRYNGHRLLLYYALDARADPALVEEVKAGFRRLCEGEGVVLTFIEPDSKALSDFYAGPPEVVTVEKLKAFVDWFRGWGERGPMSEHLTHIRSRAPPPQRFHANVPLRMRP